MAVFQECAKILVVMELLTIEVIGPITLGRTLFRIFVGIGSISHDLLAIFPIILDTSCSVRGWNSLSSLTSQCTGL